MPAPVLECSWRSVRRLIRILASTSRSITFFSSCRGTTTYHHGPRIGSEHPTTEQPPCNSSDKSHTYRCDGTARDVTASSCGALAVPCGLGPPLLHPLLVQLALQARGRLRCSHRERTRCRSLACSLSSTRTSTSTSTSTSASTSTSTTACRVGWRGVVEAAQEAPVLEWAAVGAAVSFIDFVQREGLLIKALEYLTG